MTTLRVRLPSPYHPNADSDWWRVDVGGRLVDRGSGPPGSWPAADRREAVLGADTVRLIAVTMPPLPESRRASAVAYALEDQLAAGAEDVRVCAPPPRPGEPTIARVVDRATLDRIAAHVPPFDRVVAEPDLVDDDHAWHWCVDPRGRGFVRRADGSAFATGGPADDGTLPAELAAALDRARSPGEAPDRVIVDAPVDAGRLSHRSGVRFAAGAARQIERRPPSAWMRAPDLLRNGSARPTRPQTSSLRAWAPALVLVVAAVAVQLIGTFGSWTRDRLAIWRSEREIVAIARDAGVDADEASAAAAALARRATAAAHAAGRAVDSDLLPLLARSAPALGALPAGSVRRISYGDGRLTADLAGIDEARAAHVLRDLAQGGARPLSAPIGGGVRIAVTAGP